MINKITVHTNHVSFFSVIIILLTVFFASSVNSVFAATEPSATQTKLAYIVSDTRIPFWSIMARGIKHKGTSLGYKVDIYSAENSAKSELQFTIKAIRDNVSGIIVSPTNSSACVTILKLAKKAGIPVVISDIGTDAGQYVSYISSNNKNGSYKIGKILTKKMLESGWQNGTVGIIAIPQKRANGKARTTGFMLAMDEAGIKGAGIKQQVTFSYQETYDYSKQLIEKNPTLRAIWLQGSDRYQAALDAIADAGKSNEILLISFDAEPVFLELIPRGILAGAAMQQPYLMGEEAVSALDRHLNGKPVDKNRQLPILAISTENIAKKIAIIKRNVLGLEIQQSDVNTKK